MGSQHAALWISGLKLAHNFCPQKPRGPHLGDLHVEVHANTPEERQPGGEIINTESSFYSSPDVFLAIRKRIGEFERGIRASLLHVSSQKSKWY